jgi:hypothetical protein
MAKGTLGERLYTRALGVHLHLCITLLVQNVLLVSIQSPHGGARTIFIPRAQHGYVLAVHNCIGGE